MDNIKEFPEHILNLEKTVSNIAQGDIDHAIIITINRDDVVNLYSTADDDLTNDMLYAVIKEDNCTFELEDD